MIVDNRGIVNSKKKKHCNLRSRNYDDGESAKDVVCKKSCESRGRRSKYQNMHHQGGIVPFGEMQLKNQGNISCFSYFPNSHSIAGRASHSLTSVNMLSLRVLLRNFEDIKFKGIGKI